MWQTHNILKNQFDIKKCTCDAREYLLVAFEFSDGFPHVDNFKMF